MQLNQALGSFPVKLDEKNRIILPARARATLADQTYLAQGLGECIFVFSTEQFAKFCAHLREQTLPGIDPMDFDRLFFASVVNQVPDKQGRVTIPLMHRQYAQLGRELMIIGLEDRFEIWDAARWGNYQTQHLEAFSKAQVGLRSSINRPTTTQ